jgi:hypothetical protein
VFSTSSSRRCKPGPTVVQQQQHNNNQLPVARLTHTPGRRRPSARPANVLGRCAIDRANWNRVTQRSAGFRAARRRGRRRRLAQQLFSGITQCVIHTCGAIARSAGRAEPSRTRAKCSAAYRGGRQDAGRRQISLRACRQRLSASGYGRRSRPTTSGGRPPIRPCAAGPRDWRTH